MNTNNTPERLSPAAADWQSAMDLCRKLEILLNVQKAALEAADECLALIEDVGHGTLSDNVTVARGIVLAALLQNITVRVPLIVQRDKAEREARLWETRYNEQTQLAANVLTERDNLGSLLERADEALAESGLGSQGSPLRVEIHGALKNYRMAKRVREGTNAEVRHGAKNEKS